MHLLLRLVGWSVLVAILLGLFWPGLPPAPAHSAAKDTATGGVPRGPLPPRCPADPGCRSADAPVPASTLLRPTLAA